jgi:carbamoyltransferase
MEFGPRALGNRSLLADPRDPAMRDVLNRKVKHREDFRPFAPSVLEEHAHEWFDLGRASTSYEYMLFACPVRPGRLDAIPAVVHQDGTARVQVVRRAANPMFHALLRRFADRTGVPMVLNTSFNDSEPIVCSPRDALNTFAATGIDALVLGDVHVRRTVHDAQQASDERAALTNA